MCSFFLSHFHSLLNSQIISANQPELGIWTYFPRLNMGRWSFPSQANFFSTSLHDLNRGWGFVCETSLAISFVFAIYTFVEPFWLFRLILDCVYSWANVNISFKCLPVFYLISNFPGVESRYLFGFLDQTCNKFVVILWHFNFLISLVSIHWLALQWQLQLRSNWMLLWSIFLIAWKVILTSETLLNNFLLHSPKIIQMNLLLPWSAFQSTRIIFPFEYFLDLFVFYDTCIFPKRSNNSLWHALSVAFNQMITFLQYSIESPRRPETFLLQDWFLCPRIFKSQAPSEGNCHFV